MTQRSRDGRPGRSGRQRTRRSVLAGLGTAGIASVAGCLSGLGGGSGTSDSMTIFHAGSLAPPFSEAEPDFESEHGVDVAREAKGSVASTQKITEQGRKADVLGTSDYRLIRDRVLPEYGEWYAIFTTNAMAIQYHENSTGADEISTDNWWEVLSRDDVTIGHSDPAVDPGGYRAVMAMQLGREKFQGERLYDDATYEALRENAKISTDTETNLEGQLESGKLDYVIYYKSIADTSGLPYVELQPSVDLSKATDEYANHYAKAEVETDSGTFTGAPIAYGMTVPGVAESPELGAKWVEYFSTKPGRAVLESNGLVPVDPVVVPKDGKDAIPDRLSDVATPKSTLGPLEL